MSEQPTGAVYRWPASLPCVPAPPTACRQRTRRSPMAVSRPRAPAAHCLAPLRPAPRPQNRPAPRHHRRARQSAANPRARDPRRLVQGAHAAILVLHRSAALAPAHSPFAGGTPEFYYRSRQERRATCNSPSLAPPVAQAASSSSRRLPASHPCLLVATLSYALAPCAPSSTRRFLAAVAGNWRVRAHPIPTKPDTASWHTHGIL